MTLCQNGCRVMLLLGESQELGTLSNLFFKHTHTHTPQTTAFQESHTHTTIIKWSCYSCISACRQGRQTKGIELDDSRYLVKAAENAVQEQNNSRTKSLPSDPRTSRTLLYTDHDVSRVFHFLCRLDDSICKVVQFVWLKIAVYSNVSHYWTSMCWTSRSIELNPVPRQTPIDFALRIHSMYWTKNSIFGEISHYWTAIAAPSHRSLCFSILNWLPHWAPIVIALLDVLNSRSIELLLAPPSSSILRDITVLFLSHTRVHFWILPSQPSLWFLTVTLRHWCQTHTKRGERREDRSSF